MAYRALATTVAKSKVLPSRSRPISLEDRALLRAVQWWISRVFIFISSFQTLCISEENVIGIKKDIEDALSRF